MKYATQAFCKECVVWMSLSHPNILQFAAVKINPDARRFSAISEMMKHGNVIHYIYGRKANRIRLVRPWVVVTLPGEVIDRTYSWRTLQGASNISIDPISSTETSKGYVDISMGSPAQVRRLY